MTKGNIGTMKNKVAVITGGSRGLVGPMIAAFLSDENRWVNGQRICVWLFTLSNPANTVSTEHLGERRRGNGSFREKCLYRLRRSQAN
jgi:hypothetical protein